MALKSYIIFQTVETEISLYWVKVSKLHVDNFIPQEQSRIKLKNNFVTTKITKSSTWRKILEEFVQDSSQDWKYLEMYWTSWCWCIIVQILLPHFPLTLSQPFNSKSCGHPSKFQDFQIPRDNFTDFTTWKQSTRHNKQTNNISPVVMMNQTAESKSWSRQIAINNNLLEFRDNL